MGNHTSSNSYHQLQGKAPLATNAERDITSIQVIGIEKRYKPSRHYMYIVKVRWTDGSVYIIYRNYSAFFFLHGVLLESFPVEAGYFNESERLIPELPGKVSLGRSEIRSVADERVKGLNKYCADILNLDKKISQSIFVKQFVDVRPDDIDPPKDTVKKPCGMLILLDALRLPSVTNTSDGKSNEADDMVISEPLVLEVFIAIATYNAETNTEVSFQAGDHIDVVEKNENGWWFVQVEQEQGWAPASYLRSFDNEDDDDDKISSNIGPSPNYAGVKYLTTQEYMAAYADEISFPAHVVVDVLHKLLDGWWVISYNNAVGHGPGQFLRRYDNPHLYLQNDTLPGPITRNRDGSISSAKLTPRRRSIKNIDRRYSGKEEKKDLQLYARLSMKAKEAMKRNRDIETTGQISSSLPAEGCIPEDREYCDHKYEEANSVDIKKATRQSQLPSHDPPQNPSSISPVSNADQLQSLLYSTSEISPSPTLLLERQMLQQQQQQKQQHWQNFVSRSAFFDKNQQVAEHLEGSSKLSFNFEKKDVNDNSVCDHPELLVKTTPNITVGGSCLEDVNCGNDGEYEHVKTDQSDIALEFEYGRKDASTTFDTLRRRTAARRSKLPHCCGDVNNWTLQSEAYPQSALPYPKLQSPSEPLAFADIVAAFGERKATETSKAFD